MLNQPVEETAGLALVMAVPLGPLDLLLQVAGRLFVGVRVLVRVNCAVVSGKRGEVVEARLG